MAGVSDTVVPNQWWDEEISPDILEEDWKDGMLNYHIFDFIHQTAGTIRLQGPAKMLRWAGNYVLHGYEQVDTSATNFLCALYALEISLAPIYEAYNKQPPDFRRMHGIYTGPVYAKLALPKFYELCSTTLGIQSPGNISVDPSALPAHREYAKARVNQDLMEVMEQAWNNYFASDQLSDTAMRLILDILCDEDGLRIGLGMMIYLRESLNEEVYTVSVQEHDSSYHHGIAWVINDSMEMRSANGISHWSGTALSVQGPDIQTNISTIDDNELHIPGSFPRDMELEMPNPGWSDSQIDSSPPAVELDMPSSNSSNSPANTFPSTPKYTDSSYTVPNTLDISDDSHLTCKRNISEVDDNATSESTQKRHKVMPETGNKRITRRVVPPASDVMELDFEAQPQAFVFGQQVPLPPLVESQHLRPLFNDLKGRVPEGHYELNPYERFDTLLTQRDFTQETQKAMQLSRRSICNAPHWDKVLPWDDMDDITPEELIMYFPNHVMRWPFLAIYVLQAYWDNHFQRTSALINRVRGSSCSKRHNRHAEPLPCMMKVEATLQDINYSLENVDDIYRTPQYKILKLVRQPPKQLTGRLLETVSIKEAAAYVLFPEFLDKPFSKRLLQMGLLPQHERPDSFYLKENAMMFTDGFGKPLTPQIEVDSGHHEASNPGMRFSDASMAETYQVSDIDCTKLNRGHAGEVNVSSGTESQRRPNNEMGDRELKSRPCRRGAKCQDENCKFAHPPGFGIKANDPPREYNKECKFGGKCENQNCQWEHPTGWDPLKNRALNPPPPFAPREQNRACKFGEKCENQKCQWEHPTGWDPLKNRGKTPPPPFEPSQTPCRYGAKCKNKQNCSFTHDDQQGQEKRDQEPQSSNKQAKSQQKLCKFNTKCRNSECTLAHQSPAAPPNTKVKLDQTCNYGNRCTNKKCDRSHPSPSSKAGTGGPGKGKKGDKQGQDGRKDDGGPGKRKKGDQQGQDGRKDDGNNGGPGKGKGGDKQGQNGHKDDENEGKPNPAGKDVPKEAPNKPVKYDDPNEEEL
jgi:hypothetical protein